MTLPEEWAKYLTDRAVPPEIARDRGYAVVQQGKGVDGTYAAAHGFPKKAAGLLFPLHGLLNPGAVQLRVDPAVQRLFEKPNGEPRKFLVPRGQANVLITHPATAHLLKKPKQAIFIVEGCTRVDALAAYGIPAVGILGVDNWKGGKPSVALPDFDALGIKGNRFIIVPDGDVRTNANVARAILGNKRNPGLRRHLEGKRAASVHVVALPDGLGLDDWIAKHQPADGEALFHAVKEYIVKDDAALRTPKPKPVASVHSGEGRPAALFAETVLLGDVRRDSNTLRDVLNRMGMDARFNVRSGATEMFVPRTGKWEKTTDTLTAGVIELIALNFEVMDEKMNTASRLHFGERSWTLSLGALGDRNRVDPFLEWLNGLPKWDGVQRASTWLTDALLADDSSDPLRSWASLYIVCGAIRRAIEPGYDLHEVPVLSGDPDIGKSTVVKHILPPWSHGDWFSDNLDMSTARRAKDEATQGRVIVEIPELTGLSKADLSAIDAYISSNNDGGTRKAYRRDPEDTPRRWIAVGTANPGYQLPESIGAMRRWAVVPFGGGDPDHARAYLTHSRDQLWAEALALVHSGYDPRLPSHLKTTMTARAEALASRDETLENKIDEFLEARTEFEIEELYNATRLSPVNVVNSLEIFSPAKVGSPTATGSPRSCAGAGGTAAL